MKKNSLFLSKNPCLIDRAWSKRGGQVRHLATLFQRLYVLFTQLPLVATEGIGASLHR